MKYLFVLFWLSFCWSCSDSDSTSNPTTEPDAGLVDAAMDSTISSDTADSNTAPKIPRLLLDFNAPTHTTGRLIGWNIGRGTLYGPDNDTVHPEWRSPARVKAVARLRDLRAATGDAPLVRFSGLQIDGVLGGDGYHFWDFVKPDRTITPEDNMAVFQYRALMDEIDSTPLVTLNFGSGTAEEAARYVTYLNATDPDDPLVQARQTWVNPEPWNQQIFEIGNEIYGFWNTGYPPGGDYSYANPDALNGGDPNWHNRPALNPADFAARGLQYIEHVTAVEPQAQFWIPLTQASMDAWDGMENAIEALKPLLLHPAVNAVVIHHYQVDDLAVLGWIDYNSPDLMVAGSELFAPLYKDVRTKLDALERPTPLDIVITEYHTAGAFARSEFERGDEAGVGLGLADILIFMAKFGVASACQHMALNFQNVNDPERDRLLESWYVPFRLRDDGTLLDMPSYTITKLFAESMRTDTIAVELIDVPTITATVDEQAFAYPSVQAVGFASQNTGTLVLLHRDQQSKRTFEVEVPEGWQVQRGRMFAPNSFNQDAATNPTPVVDMVWEQRGRVVQIELPPHSVVALEWTR